MPKNTNFSNVLGIDKLAYAIKIADRYMTIKSSKVKLLQYKLLVSLGPSYTKTSRGSNSPGKITARVVPPFQKMSNFYCNNFNHVDRFNTYWNKIKWPPIIMNKNVHMTWSLVYVAIVNAWIAYRELNALKVKSKVQSPNITIRQFVKRLAKSMDVWLRQQERR